MTILSTYFARQIIGATSTIFFSAYIFLLLIQAARLSEINPALIFQSDQLLILLYALPHFITYLLPVSFLLGLLLTYNRLRQDNEIIALKNTGLKKSACFKIPFLIGGIFFLFLLAVSCYLEPLGLKAIKSKLLNGAKRELLRTITAGSFNYFFNDLVLRASWRGQPVKLKSGGWKSSWKGVVIIDRRDPQTESITFAKRAELSLSPQNMLLELKLEKGAIHLYNHNHSQGYQLVNFQEQHLKLNLKKMLKNSIKFISNLQTLSLGDLFRELESEVQTKKLNNLRLAWQRKFSFPFCVLLFVLPGVCLGAGAGGKGRHKSYLWGILMVGIYFILWQTADTLVNSDFFSPLAGAWMPNLVILVMGVYLLKRLSW